ncbi:MBL fold metallo-hydrolase [[Clostridium] hylemonae]|uniref:MBL fold metallo-hydrolase n=1 Tax=[Clostridium] hylemonae TaxID=89153 RepID=UPI001FCBD5EF|nr:MBL fold metallo-hydrolase [[Clostridium] hylemonae]BDF03956.1 MBL fold metallo-hydrolase [[Clostridium] hylemonae]
MKLRVLIDNNTYIDQYFLGEPALSYYIESGDKRILFDTGYSDAFMYNARKMGIDLGNLTHIILSHGHNDHTGGLAYLKEKFDLKETELIAHPACFNEKKAPEGNIGAPVTETEMRSLCRLNLKKEPFWVDEEMVFLGEIQERLPFEKRKCMGQCRDGGSWEADHVTEDSAAVFKTPKGLFIVTGCSHSGICNIIEQAKDVCRCGRIAGVIGGFHLFDVDERLEDTIRYLRQTDAEMLYPCHCVSFAVKAKMNETMPVREVGTGMTIEL